MIQICMITYNCVCKHVWNSACITIELASYKACYWPLLQNIAGIHVPHQTASDGVQYALSTKTTTKGDHVTGNDVKSNKEDQQVSS